MVYKTFVFILVSSSCIGQNVYWEDLTDSKKSDILSKCQSEKIVKCYRGEFRLSDDELTSELLNDIENSNDSTIALAFFILNNICRVSDGALSEMVGYTSNAFLINHPKFTITFFTKERLSGKNRPIMDRYAVFLGYELSFVLEGTSTLEYTYNEVKSILESSVGDNGENGVTLALFWSKVDETIKRMD